MGTQWDNSGDGEIWPCGIGKVPAGHDWRTTLKGVNHLVSTDEFLDTLEEMMADCKEVKLAWANGDRVQGSDGAEWVTWENDYRLDLSVWDKWRVKPKTKKVKQWERKFYDPELQLVRSTACDVPIKDWDAYECVPRIWLTEQTLVEYEVPT